MRFVDKNKIVILIKVRYNKKNCTVCIAQNTHNKTNYSRLIANCLKNSAFRLSDCLAGVSLIRLFD